MRLKRVGLVTGWRGSGGFQRDEFTEMVSGLTARAQREQAPHVQLVWFIAPALGVKNMALEDWYTGYARERVSVKTQNPSHLERALQIGLKLGRVSDQAFLTVRQLRE